jgi:hypothetical protein
MDALTYTAFELTLTDKVNMPHVMHYIARRLSDYDLRHLESIKLLPLNKRAILHGCCVYPVRSAPRARTFKSGYRIRASVNVEMAPPYIYQHWGRIPSKKCKQGWYSGHKIFVFSDLDDAAVHTLAHECFHFLSHSGQVGIKNTEANANWWADQWTADFQLIR